MTPAARLNRTARALGCRRLDTGSGGTDDRDTFAYWLDMCYVVPLGEGQTAVVSPRLHVVDLYGEVLRGVGPLIAYLALAQIGRTRVARLLRGYRVELLDAGGHDDNGYLRAPRFVVRRIGTPSRKTA